MSQEAYEAIMAAHAARRRRQSIKELQEFNEKIGGHAVIKEAIEHFEASNDNFALFYLEQQRDKFKADELSWLKENFYIGLLDGSPNHRQKL